MLCWPALGGGGAAAQDDAADIRTAHLGTAAAGALRSRPRLALNYSHNIRSEPGTGTC